MTDVEIIKTYKAADLFLAMLGSTYGEKIRATYPELVVKAEDLINTYQTKYMDLMVKETPGSSDLLKETVQIKSVLSKLPTTSQESIRLLDEELTKNIEKLQNTLLFDPILFYNKYLFSIVAPNTSHKNPDIITNERFATWFGGSKVVDQNKNPMVVFHGTGGLIEEYDKFKFSPFPAAYFAESESYSEWFAKYRGGNNILLRCYLRVLNPIDLTGFELEKVKYNDFINFVRLKYGYELPENKRLMAMSKQLNGMWAWQYLRNGVEWLNYIKIRKEFDGFYYYENNPQDIVGGKENITKAWMVFEGSQIKAADIRNTTYSLNSNSIIMEKGGITC